MTTTKCLTDPDLLAQLHRPLLTEFLRRFDLGPAHNRLLDETLSPSEFCSGLSALLASPDTLPGPMGEAIRAIEDLAAPENRARLDAAYFRAPLSLNIDPRSHPLLQALKLWLHRPFDPPPLPDAPGQPAPDSPASPVPTRSPAANL